MLPKQALYQAELRPDASLEPLKLAHGFPAVAVRTSNFALLDFLKDALPGEAAVYHFADVPGLDASNVVKLKNDRIGLTAIRARLSTQIFNNARAISDTVPTLIDIAIAAILYCICTVMSPIVVALAIPTNSMSDRPSARPEGKGFYGYSR